jgi:superfamily I DNA/RNA helicase
VIEPAGAAWDRASTARTLLRLVRSLAEQATSDRTRPLRNDLIKVMNWIGHRRLAQDQLLALGRKLLVRRKVRVLDGAARDLVGAVPAIYARFRRRSASRGVYYRKDAEASSFSSVLSPLETDVVILAMLRNARRSLERLPDAAWLQSITGRYVMQLFVDEATDFSSVQLACMLELSHPKLRSWFACGDFRQRITKSGITSHDEIEWLGRVAQVQNLEVREITSEYRQSERLKALARALWDERDSSGITNHAETPADDPAPLLVESISGGLLARWLANRILEVERLVGRLPSIAVFVDSEHSIDEVVKSTAVFLAARNIQIVGCRDGRDVGNSQEVRVFDIQHIKGLEFEAVFFVGVDALAERMPDLFDRYIYVGVTRAATFLGITCRTRLPEKLESIRPLLSTGGWE